MVKKTIPPPCELFFVCPKCGTYRVPRRTLRRFIVPELRRKLYSSLRSGAIGAKAKFEGSCPRCTPEGTHEIELVALRLPRPPRTH